MTTVTALPAPGPGEPGDGDGQLPADWLDWLRERLDPRWRAGEWDAGLLLFTGDPSSPGTGVAVCPRPGCGMTTNNPCPSGYCTTCHREFTGSGLGKDEFEAARPRRTRHLDANHRNSACEVPACERDMITGGMCKSHYSLWSRARNRPGADRTAWMTAPGLPLPASPGRCAVRGCGREKISGAIPLCHNHQRKWLARAGSTGETDASSWAEYQPPYLSAHMFSLAPLLPPARSEVLYALQQRDARLLPLRPGDVRHAVTAIAGLPSVALASGEIRDRDGASRLLPSLRWEVMTAFDQFRGIDPAGKLIWDLRTVSQQIPSLKEGVSPLRHQGSLDFGQVRQEWLRDILMHWARTASPDSMLLRRRHRACVIASGSLELRSDGGSDPSVLQFSDVTMLVDAFKHAAGAGGKLYAPSYQDTMLRDFFDLLDFARREGTADSLSSRFVRHPGYHSIRGVDENEDEIGKAIPDTVIRQLDRHLHLIGKGLRHGPLPPHAVTAMFEAVYVILRDTGRRPAEVAGLDLDCLEYDHGEYQLVWHNVKGRRLRRRLPVVQGTADAVNGWKEIRACLDIPGNCAGSLFPSVTGLYPHMEPDCISRAVRLWADSVPVLDSDQPGPDGTPLPFDRSRIFPYAFRHTFCQRYADAGIALHVLQSLMDHRSADTTAAYYQVSKKMKREAVDTLRVLASDRAGNPAPIGSAAAYEMRSVAVPWGNCTEPSNVKAGGSACPVRWQCPGCAHYRPDPSHLPAIEDQARALRANLETARAIGAAEWAIAGMEGEIDGYATVIDAMKDRMDALPAAERREIEEASKILRRMRAGTAATGPVPLPMPAIRPAGLTA